jgi:ribosomal-protein-alanine N-acetyltransferase
VNSLDNVETARLTLRRPRSSDAAEILQGYAADREVTRYVCWPRHRSISDSHDFLKFSDETWARWPLGPYIIENKETGALIGSLGIAFETPHRASAGYVLARNSWGKGYASEALRGLLAVTKQTKLQRIYALCHCSHPASIRVPEKCDFKREGRLERYTIFPNLGLKEPSDVFLLRSYKRLSTSVCRTYNSAV